MSEDLQAKGRASSLTGGSFNVSGGTIDGTDPVLVLVVAGQSNAAGFSELSGPGSISTSGYFWNGSLRQWMTPTRDPVWPSRTGGMVPALVERLNTYTSKPVCIINVAVGSTNCAINVHAARGSWASNGELRSRARTIINEAKSKINAPYSVIGTVWVQGESDAAWMRPVSAPTIETLGDYTSSLRDTIGWFLQNVGGKFYASHIGYCLGTTSVDTYVDSINSTLTTVTNDIQNAYLATTLPTTFKADGKLNSTWHYKQSAYNELGVAFGTYIGNQLN